MLKKFEKYYNLATGFCSIYLWTNVLEDNIWGLIENIYNELNDFYAFDFELNHNGLFKEFHHLYFQFVNIFHLAKQNLLTIVKFVLEFATIHSLNTMLS